MSDILVEGPNGAVVQFPASTPPDVINRAMSQAFGGGQPALRADVGATSPTPSPHPDIPKPTPVGVRIPAPAAPPAPSQRFPGIDPRLMGPDVMAVLEGASDPKGDLEFPDAGEITDIDMGFLESLAPTVKLGATSNATGKANILAQHFAEDPRFEGAFQDKNGHPLIKWDGKPYYVNLPGFSGTDINDFMAAVTAFYPASRAGGAGASVMQRGATSLPLYAATDAGMQVASQALGSGEDVDYERAGMTGLFGAATEAFLPPILAGAKRAFSGGVGASSNLPQYASALNRGAAGQPKPGVVAGQGGIPKTAGQASGDIAQISREEAMRKGARGESAQNIMRGFDDVQRGAVADAAGSIEEMIGAGAGIGDDTMSVVGQRLQDALAASGARMKGAASSALTDAMKPGQVKLTPNSFRNLITGMRTELRARAFDLGSDDFKAASRILEQAKQFANMNLKSVDLQAVEMLRRRINGAISRNADRPVDAALMTMKKGLDTWLDEAVENGLMQGDEAAVNALKSARSDYAVYKSLFGGTDPAGRAMARILDTKQASPIQTVRYFVSLTRAGMKAETQNLVERAAQIFGRESDEFNLIKTAYLSEMFTTSSAGGRAITPNAIDKNVRFMLDGDGAALSRALFTPDEMAVIRSFADDVADIITPADAMNPSGSGWAVMREMADRGIIPALREPLGNAAAGMLGMTGVMEPVASGMRNSMGGNAARDAVRGLQARLQSPLLSTATVHALTTRQDQEN
jgi:hypothetical protein